MALCLLFGFGPADAAELRDGAWQLDTWVDLSGSTTYLVNGGRSTTLPVISAEFGADLWSADAPIKGGVFASYELETLSEGDEILAVGSWAKYSHLRWEVVTTVAFVEMGSAGNFWMHASKLGYRPRPGHKLSIEALNLVGDNSRPAYQFSYGVDLPHNVSLLFGVGLGSNRIFDLAGNAKVVWSLW